MNELCERGTVAGTGNATRFFVAAGHTDNAGPEDQNCELVQKRASKVAFYLMSTQGVDPVAVSAVSYGESKRLAENSSVGGRRRNRRVEILVYSK